MNKRLESKRTHRAGLAIVGLLLLAATGAVVAVIATRAESRAEKVVGSLARVRELIAKHDLDKAEAALAGFTSPDADVLRAKILLERGRWHEARDVLANVLKDQPEHYEAARMMAEGCRDEGEVDLAITWFQRVAKLDPKDARPWREIARLAQRKGDTMTALMAAQQALALDPALSDMAALCANPGIGPGAGVGGNPFSAMPTPGGLPGPGRSSAAGLPYAGGRMPGGLPGPSSPTNGLPTPNQRR